MPTVVLNAYSKAYPAITNRIKASVLSATSPYAVIASIIDTTAGHPARLWNFPGLPRNNYGFSLDEIDGGGAVVSNLALFSVVPGQIDGLLQRNDEQPRVGTTTGFNAGDSSFTFDGTGGKPDYVGWEIVPSELTGRGILVRGLDYSWDKTTGTFALLQPGDVFVLDQYYNIHFEPIQNPAGNSYPTITDFEINLITANTTLDDTYFGKKLICEPTGDYIEVTLPSLASIPDGRRLMVEASGTPVKSVKILPLGGDVINWLRGNIYINAGESISIYKFSRPAADPEWRVCEADGNFKTVGQSVGDDAVAADVFNRQLLDGSSLDKYKFARLYNEFILNLPLAQVVDYDSWATGNNKYLWSRANSANPLYADQFHIPDRRDIFEKNNKTGKAGDYIAAALAEHFHYLCSGSSSTGADPIATDNFLSFQNELNGDFKYTLKGKANAPIYLRSSSAGSGTETHPSHYLINKYVLI